MPLSYCPIAGEYRRAIGAAAAVSDVATLQQIALDLVAYYEARQDSATPELVPANRSPYPGAGPVARAQG